MKTIKVTVTEEHLNKAMEFYKEWAQNGKFVGQKYSCGCLVAQALKDHKDLTTAQVGYVFVGFEEGVARTPQSVKRLISIFDAYSEEACRENNLGLLKASLNLPQEFELEIEIK
jgi:hypothetical protein